MGRAIIIVMATILVVFIPLTVEAATDGSRFDPADFASLGSLESTFGIIVFDTSNVTVTGFGNGIVAYTEGGVEVAVFTFDTVSITGSTLVFVTGSRPLVILSKADFTLSRTLNVSGLSALTDSGASGSVGGANGGSKNSAGLGTGGGGRKNNEGGAGAGYGGSGGKGGKDNNNVGNAYGDQTLYDLFGGSGGAGGGNNSNAGGGGGGGGAVAIAAADEIWIQAGGEIQANGGNGAFALRYGGGGASGGSILLSAPTVTNDGTLEARGGNGGGGILLGDGGGGGAGGRIAIYANNVTMGTTDVNGGGGGVGLYPGDGGSLGTTYTDNFSDPPTVLSVERMDATPTNGPSVRFRVTFSGSVSNVQASDLSLQTAGLSGSSISGVTGSGSEYEVDVGVGTGTGTLRLDVLDFDTITDAFNQPLGGAGQHNGDFTTGEVYTVDTIEPTLTVGGPSTSVTRTGPVTYTLTYGGASAVSLSAGDITLNATGTAGGSVSVSGSGTLTRTVTISGIAGDGTLGISVAGGTASDDAGNVAGSAGPSATFVVDNTAPGIAISAPSSTITSNGPVTYTVTYSGASSVTLAAGHVTLITTESATGSVSVSGAGSISRTVVISGITGSGTVGISIAGGTAVDAAGNAAPGAGPSATCSVVNGAVSASIGAPSATITNGDAVTFPVTYSGATAVTLTAADVILNTTGTVAGVASVSGTGSASRTVTVSGITGDGTLGISLVAGTANNSGFIFAPAAGPSATATIDNTPPSITVSAPSPATTCGDDVTYHVEYSDTNSLTLIDGHFTAAFTGTASATLAVNATGDASRDVVLQDTSGDGMATISISAGSAVDAAGNQAAAWGPSDAAQFDFTAPSVSVGAPSATITHEGPVTYTATYTDAQEITLSPSDITLNTTGTATGVVSVSGSGTTTRTITIASISGDGTLGITIGPGTASDNTCNDALASSASATFTVDNSAPTVSIGAPSESITNTGPVTYSIAYSGADTVTLTGADVTLNSTGTASGTVSVSGSGNTTRTVTVTGVTGDGTLSISLVGGTASDTAGNLTSAVGPSQTFTVDNTAPGLTIDAPSATLTQSGPVTYTVTYTDADSILLAPAMITLTKTGSADGTLSILGSGTAERVVQIDSITGSGTLGISIASGSASDQAGNTAGPAGPSATFAVDNSPPTVSIGAPSVSSTQNGPVTYTVSYSGATAVTLSDADILSSPTATAAADVAVTGSGTSARTVTFSNISGNGTIGFGIAPGTASDDAGNLAAAGGPSATFSVDNAPPTIALGAWNNTLTQSGPVDSIVTYTGASAVTLTASDVTLHRTGTADATVSVVGTGTAQRTVRLSSVVGDGTLSYSIAASTAVDTIGNEALAAGPSSLVTVDNTSPTVAIGPPSSSITGTGPVSFTVTYAGADVVTLNTSDVTLNAAGTADGDVVVSGSGAMTRTVTIQNIVGIGTLGISLASGTASDTAGNVAGPAGPSTTFDVDNEAISLSIGQPSVPVTQHGPVTIEITYTAAATVSLDSSDIVLNGTGTAAGTVSVSGSGNVTRMVTISDITGDGDLSISVLADSGRDAANTPAPAAGPSAAVMVDNMAPAVSIGSPSMTSVNSGPVSFPVMYSGADTISLSAADVVVHRTGTADASVAVSGTGAARSVTLSGVVGDGTLGISIAAGTAEDAAGNVAEGAGPSATVAVDNTPPGVSITGPSVMLTKAGPVSYTVHYSGALDVVLDVAHISVVRSGTADATVVVTGNGSSQRTVTLFDTVGDGTLGIAVGAGSATDAVGNAAAGTPPSATVTVDNTAPILTVLGENPVEIEYTLPYVDAGATAVDNVDGDLTESILTGDFVDTSTPGVYTVSYYVEDSAGNPAATQSRTVTVVQETEEQPLIEFLGGTVCRPGICVTVNGNRVFTPAGVLQLVIDRPSMDLFTPTFLDSVVPGSWFDIKPNTTSAADLGTITFDYPDADQDGVVDGTYFPEDGLFAYFIDPATGITVTIDGVADPESNQFVISIDRFGVFALGSFHSPIDPDQDSDGDGLTDEFEGEINTDPLERDTDEDGVDDGDEWTFGTDPLDPNDYPSVSVWGVAGFAAAMLLLIMLGLVYVRRACHLTTATRDGKG